MGLYWRNVPAQRFETVINTARPRPKIQSVTFPLGSNAASFAVCSVVSEAKKAVNGSSSEVCVGFCVTGKSRSVKVLGFAGFSSGASNPRRVTCTDGHWRTVSTTSRRNPSITRGCGGCVVSWLPTSHVDGNLSHFSKTQSQMIQYHRNTSSKFDRSS